jgi:hypothetical protein
MKFGCKNTKKYSKTFLFLVFFVPLSRKMYEYARNQEDFSLQTECEGENHRYGDEKLHEERHP